MLEKHLKYILKVLEYFFRVLKKYTRRRVSSTKKPKPWLLIVLFFCNCIHLIVFRHTVVLYLSRYHYTTIGYKVVHDLTLFYCTLLCTYHVRRLEFALKLRFLSITPIKIDKGAHPFSCKRNWFLKNTPVLLV